MDNHVKSRETPRSECPILKAMLIPAKARMAYGCGHHNMTKPKDHSLYLVLHM